MSSKTLSSQCDFDEIRKLISAERKTFLKSGLFDQDDENLIRNEAQALLILDKVKPIYEMLMKCFIQYPSLVHQFNESFGNYNELTQRDGLLSLMFLDEFLFPEKQTFPIVDEHSDVDVALLDQYAEDFKQWMDDAVLKHQQSQDFIRQSMDIKSTTSMLLCRCESCTADYRTKLREKVLETCVAKINQTSDEMDKLLEADYRQASMVFLDLKKDLDKIFYSIRYKFRRSTINRMEGEVKRMLKREFYFPSSLAASYVENLGGFFKSILKAQGLRGDLLNEQEWERFYTQLGPNIWRSEKYLEIEFKKQIKSILFLKRKDISASILKDYLGQFWMHSDARSIKRKIIYHVGPTNSGKTYYAIEALCQAQKGCYLAPLRLLAAELYDTMNAKGIKTTLLTGEEVIEIDGATHFASTIEMARLNQNFDCCVIDEIQMITDYQRGWAWTRAFVNLCADEVHICGDSSVMELIQSIVQLTGDELVIKEYQRMTDLLVEENPVNLASLQRSDALIVFSRKNALKYKRDLETLGFKVSIIYGRLGPEVRREQARKFDVGETDIIVSTDAISMGMNLPIRRIIFTTLSKFIDSREYPISKSEIKQIAGRSGRYGRFPTGYVSCLKRVDNGISQINDALAEDLAQQTKAMVGPDLVIFDKVNTALTHNGLPVLMLSEFLRLFNTMSFKKPFYCVDLKEMIEVAEMVEEADAKKLLTTSEVFGFSCAPVNLGLMEHVQYFVWILNHFVNHQYIKNEEIDYESKDIDYLETTIKCVELYQWLARHFNNHLFQYVERDLLDNKGKAIEKLNDLLSEKIVRTCSSCGKPLDDDLKFNICETCFKERRIKYKKRNYSNTQGPRKKTSRVDGKNASNSGNYKHRKKNSFSKSAPKNKRFKSGKKKV